MLSNTTTKIDLAKEVTGEIANPTNFLRCLFSMSVIAGQLKSPLFNIKVWTNIVSSSDRSQGSSFD